VLGRTRKYDFVKKFRHRVISESNFVGLSKLLCRTLKHNKQKVAAKSFDIPATSLSVLHNFDGSTN